MKDESQIEPNIKYTQFSWSVSPIVCAFLAGKLSEDEASYQLALVVQVLTQIESLNDQETKEPHKADYEKMTEIETLLLNSVLTALKFYTEKYGGKTINKEKMGESMREVSKTIIQKSLPKERC